MLPAPNGFRYIPEDTIRFREPTLNEAGESLEGMIGRFCRYCSLPLPRRYRRQAGKACLAFAKCRKHTAEKAKAVIRKQLGYVHRGAGYLEQFMPEGFVPDKKDCKHQPALAASHSQGKVAAPAESGAKSELSLNTEGYGRIEKISFDAYSEGAALQEAAERFRERTGHYPGTIRRGFLQIRYTEPVRTAGTAKIMGYVCQAPAWEDLLLPSRPRIKSRSIRTARTGLKRKGSSV